MKISIIYTANGPFRAFIDFNKAVKEYEKLRDMDDYVDYSVMELPVEDEQNLPVKKIKGLENRP